MKNIFSTGKTAVYAASPQLVCDSNRNIKALMLRLICAVFFFCLLANVAQATDVGGFVYCLSLIHI